MADSFYLFDRLASSLILSIKFTGWALSEFRSAARVLAASYKSQGKERVVRGAFKVVRKPLKDLKTYLLHQHL